MKDILDRIADSSANESSHELICRLRDCAHEIEDLRSALACRPDAQADERYDLLQAAVNCPHEIESNRVVLHYSDKQPGHNALAQLRERLTRAAAPQAEAAQEVPGWMPIDTAPKTGRTLLLGYPNALGKWRTTRGKWMSENYIAEYWEDPDDAEPGWYETPVEAEDIPNCWFIEPTHWMPLPAAPDAAPSPDREHAGETEATAQAVCQTCNGNGMIGGPSYHAPDEGGEPCPDCCDTPSYCSSVRRCTAQDASPSREHGKQDCPHGVDDGACKQCYGEAAGGEQGAAKGVCQRCGGTGVVDDGEITGAGGVEFENGPVKCVKNCPDCAASAPTLGEQPQAAEPKGMTDEQPSFTNPLTPYGMLVRALRIVAGTTLYDMAKALLTTPAKLSSMEFGRIEVTPEFAFDIAAHFDALGIPGTQQAISASLSRAKEQK